MKTALNKIIKNDYFGYKSNKTIENLVLWPNILASLDSNSKYL